MPLAHPTLNRRVQVILNPAAGRSRPALEALFEPYTAACDIALTIHPGDAERLARAAAESGADVVAVCGGDGTLSEAARGLYSTGVPLAILPGGTANLLARDLGIPRHLQDAVALIFEPQAVTRAIDMGRAGDRLFFHLGIGLEGEMVRRAGRAAKRAAGLLAYYWSALVALPTYRPARYRLTLDGETVEMDGINCAITSYGSIGLAGLSLSRTIDPGDGLLDVIVIRRADFKRLVMAGTSALLARDLSRAIWHRQARDLTVETAPPRPMTCDGETDPDSFTGLTVSVVPGAIRVLVP
jgi:YegS/Rv2252/BmrU family lipid kinase